MEQLDYLYQACERAGQKIYLFIDEYDHFTNAILSDADSLHRYTNETHGEGYLRAFFNKVKTGTDSSIKRCFITDVSPVTMDDLTSGFNIGTNYSLTSKLNQMMGFTEEEVREMLTYYSTNSPFRDSVDELIKIMKPWYDNHFFLIRFSIYSCGVTPVISLNCLKKTVRLLKPETAWSMSQLTAVLLISIKWRIYSMRKRLTSV